MKKIILHVTHTDIKNDSRILKAMGVFEDMKPYTVFGIGVTEKSEKNSNLSHWNVFLKSRFFLKKLPRILRLFLLSPLIIMIEFNFVVLYYILKRRPSIIHAHDYIALIPCYVYSKFFSCKLIYDAHELESKKNGTGNFEGKLIAILEKFAWPRVDGFITVSESIRKWYITNFGDKKSIVILNSPDFVQNKNFDFKKDFRSIFSICDDKLIAVYVGLFVKGRGIERILEIANYTAKIHYVFLGSGELKDLIENSSKKMKNISIHPPVKHTDVVDYLKSADIGLCLLEEVSLSDYYAVPNKLLEYSFSGLYVIASDFPEMRSVIDEYELGLCIPKDHDQSIAVINSISPELVKSAKAKGKDRLFKLSWENQKNKLIDLYNIIDPL